MIVNFCRRALVKDAVDVNMNFIVESLIDHNRDEIVELLLGDFDSNCSDYIPQLEDTEEVYNLEDVEEVLEEELHKRLLKCLSMSTRQ